MRRPAVAQETADGADHNAGTGHTVALGGELGKAGKPLRAAKGGHQPERLVDGAVRVALPTTVARALALPAGQRPTTRARPYCQGRCRTPRARPAPTRARSDIAGPPATGAGHLGHRRLKAASAGQAAHTGLEPEHMTTIDARARAPHTTTGDRLEAQELTTGRAITPSLGFPVRRPAPVAESLVLAAYPSTAPGAVGGPHSGGIERPREALAGARGPLMGLGWASMGVVSTSKRSLGVQPSAVHSATSVCNFSCAGSFVNNADTEAADISRPARSTRSRRSSTPVQTSRCAAAIRSRHLMFMVLPPVRPRCPISPDDRHPR
jgi:hypothetical protein